MPITVSTSRVRELVVLDPDNEVTLGYGPDHVSLFFWVRTSHNRSANIRKHFYEFRALTEYTAWLELRGRQP